MAEQVDDRFLLYLLDMAILEANRRARSLAESGAGANAQFLESGNSALGHNFSADVKVVR